MPEARLEQTKYGLAPAEEGWFVVNVREGAWMTNEHFGEAFVIEGDAVAFPQIGYTVHVLHPGQPNGLYHREEDQEDFLVLAGECIAIVDGGERGLRAVRGRSATRRGARDRNAVGGQAIRALPGMATGAARQLRGAAVRLARSAAAATSSRPRPANPQP